MGSSRAIEELKGCIACGTITAPRGRQSQSEFKSHLRFSQLQLTEGIKPRRLN